MKDLFSEYPTLRNEEILLRKMEPADAQDLGALSHSEAVYRYLPTFLYEQKYPDPRTVIERMDAECFDAGESILLAVCRRSQPDHLVGIAEIYNYEAKKEKASIGYRLHESVWGQGIATQVVGLLRDYLIQEVGLRTITAHIMCENAASARAVQKNGFLNKYPDLYGDWGFDQLSHTDKYVFKREWLDVAADGTGRIHSSLPPVQVEQYVMAYLIEQDRIRAMLPEGFTSLRPVLRINAEIRDEKVVYAEFNTPVARGARRGWLNIASWKSSSGDAIHFAKDGRSTVFTASFLHLRFTPTGKSGGCPAEKDNDGCYYLGNDTEFRPAEKIDAPREFCDCEFAWHFCEGDARGVSEGGSLPAFAQAQERQYPKEPLSPEGAARIPCRKVLGAYAVKFRRYGMSFSPKE